MVSKSKKKKDDGLWFKNKRYGYGWVPASWQGWLALLGYVGLALFGVWFFLSDSPEERLGGEIIMFFLYISGLSILLITLAYKKGTKPRWQRGGKPKPKK